MVQSSGSPTCRAGRAGFDCSMLSIAASNSSPGVTSPAATNAACSVASIHLVSPATPPRAFSLLWPSFAMQLRPRRPTRQTSSSPSRPAPLEHRALVDPANPHLHHRTANGDRRPLQTSDGFKCQVLGRSPVAAGASTCRQRRSIPGHFSAKDVVTKWSPHSRVYPREAAHSMGQSWGLWKGAESASSPVVPKVKRSRRQP